MPFRGISSQIALPFALFVALGSLGLVVWLTERGRAGSRGDFRELAESNARFIARSNLPASGGLADSLSEVLELEVRFGTPGEPLPKMLPEGQVVDVGGGRESVAWQVRAGERVQFTRQRESLFQQLWTWPNLLPLAAFWGLSLVLAAVVSRRVVRPLRSLADTVGEIGIEGGDEFPEARRPDEIGQLSRALTGARGRLAEERKRREENERAALLGKMATGLAHEIRNPVAAVRLHAQLLEECARCAPSSATIVAEAETVEGLVNQWMFLSKPEPPERRRRDMGEWLGSSLDAIGRAADHADVTIARDIEEGLEAEIDAARLGQVVRNIALNALQAMPDGGTLRVSQRPVRGGVEIVFEDEGEGFSAQAHERHDELFFSTKEGGMGVGLSVSSEIVRAHGGELAVANRPSGGAEVRVWLPPTEPHQTEDPS